MLFFDAFVGLSANQELTSLYEDVEVTRVVASKQSKKLYICIKSTHLIDRPQIIKMQTLNKQLFLHTNKAIPKPQFELSAQYDLALFPMYQDTILDELREESLVNYMILANADIKSRGWKCVLGDR